LAKTHGKAGKKLKSYFYMIPTLLNLYFLLRAHGGDLELGVSPPVFGRHRPDKCALR